MGQTVRAEMEGDPPRVDRATLEGLAEHAYEARKGDAARGIAADSARGIALGQGAEVVIDSHFPDGVDGLSLMEAALLIVRYSRDNATLALRILHELAHLILDRLGWRYSHSDVWYLALAMAAPRSLLMRQPANSNALDIAALAGIPAWAAATRLECAA